MSDTLQALIAELRELRVKYGDDVARAALDTRTARLAPEKRARLEALIFLGGAQTGDVTIGPVAGGDQLSAGGDAAKGAVNLAGEARSTGANIGVNQGTVQLFFGASPPADGKELLDSYLRTLVVDHGRLRLGKLLGKEQSGREQVTMPPISLLKVFTSLTTTAMLQVSPLHLVATVEHDTKTWPQLTTICEGRNSTSRLRARPRTSGARSFNITPMSLPRALCTRKPLR